mgnify:CR=1 FL=1
MIGRKTARSALVLCLLALICCGRWAHALDLEEYRVKASLLGNFAMFTEWPDAVGDTLHLCVYGPDPFGEDLSSLKGKKIARRSLAVKRVSSVDALGDCQIVFISRAVISNLPRVLDADAMAAFLDGLGDADGDDPVRAARDRALFELAYSSGLRVSELVGARWRDADAGLTELRVAGKGGKTRVVPVGAAARAALAQWRALAGGADHVFPGRAGGHLSVRTVQARLHHLSRVHGLPQRLHPHLLRHSCASHVLESSQDLRGVQELLGHADIATTQVYTHLDFQHLARVYDAAHPRARRKPE